MTTKPRRDPYTGELLDQPHWMLLPPGQRMPFPPGRDCLNPDCGVELSRWDPGPQCWRCHQRAQAKAAAAAAERGEEEAAA